MSLKVRDNEICQVFHNEKLEVIDVSWSLSIFIQSVCEKHREPFWVSADVMGENGNIDEAFHYNKITHTGSRHKRHTYSNQRQNHRPPSLGKTIWLESSYPE